MIQRVQSLLLIIITILYSLLFFVPVFSWNVPTQAGEGFFNLTALYNIPFTVLNVIIMLFSIFIITQYKNRKQQRSYVYILSFIIVINICLYMYYMFKITVMNEYTFMPARSFGMYSQLLSLILSFFAARRIKKDDDLVKSIDRIR